MTRRQKQVYDFILSYVEQHQISPTMQEIADHLGIKNRSNVHAFLKKMEEHGLVRKSKTKLSRSIEIVTEPKPCEHCIQLREVLQKIADLEHEDLPAPKSANETVLWVCLDRCITFAENALKEKE